ncbi:RteC domain-containing protein [Mucilaginibacter sp. HD30]
MKWTGDTINLVEIAYGIWLTGQINHGNAGIAEITQFLETSFRVNIGRPFRRWQSISNRKRVSPVKYVDQIKDAILKRLDDENA